LKATTDKLLHKKVLASLAADDRTATANLHVGVLNGFVHLAGVVSSLDIRTVAAELAGNIYGVRGVINRIDAPGAPRPARIINLHPENRDLKVKKQA
jgi:osmotically-inducible protein OsmY